MDYVPRVVKQPADSVPQGESISRTGKHVWCAYDPETGELVSIAATAKEVREAYRRVYLGAVYGRAPEQLTDELDGRPNKPRKLM